jgi:hypothetical protein
VTFYRFLATFLSFATDDVVAHLGTYFGQTASANIRNRVSKLQMENLVLVLVAAKATTPVASQPMRCEVRTRSSKN